MFEAPEYLNVDITVQQLVDFMGAPRRMTAPLLWTPVTRVLITLMQILRCAHTESDDMGEPACLRIESLTRTAMASIVDVDGERYQFSPVVRVLLSSSITGFPSALLGKRLFRKAPAAWSIGEREFVAARAAKLKEEMIRNSRPALLSELSERVLSAELAMQDI